MKTCTRCGLRVEDELTKCNWCGCTELGSSDALRYKEYKPRHEGYYLGKAYGFSILSAILSFFVKLFAQGRYTYLSLVYKNDNLVLSGEYVKGIHRSSQPFYMAIPIIAALASLYYILYDKDADLNYRIRASVVSAIFIMLAIYVILSESVSVSWELKNFWDLAPFLNNVTT